MRADMKRIADTVKIGGIDKKERCGIISLRGINASRFIFIIEAAEKSSCFFIRKGIVRISKTAERQGGEKSRYAIEE